ncbi:MAG: cold shock domain-containing protein [Magnetococcales bacterium]|nr:cold shock domain-containing protein [Magnetococcales bacterium]
MENNPVEKTFLQIRIFNSDQAKKSMSDFDWAIFFNDFFEASSKIIHTYSGQVVRLSSEGILVIFEDTFNGVQAAVDLQESIKTIDGHSSCAIGVATGQAYKVNLTDNRIDYIGACVDIAIYLAIRARGNAILLHAPLVKPGENITIHSKAGEVINRPQQDYFIEQPPVKLPAFTHPISCFSINWQVQPSHFLSTHPIEDEITSSILSDTSPDEQVHFGRISAFKKERGFGFIQFYTEDQEYNEIYFHMTYVINQTPVQEHDHVQFVIKPGKEGRPQACSVLVMGSRMQGQIESIEADGSAHITIHNQDFGLIRFFALPQELNSKDIQINDVVEFTVGSGSDTEGLIAIDIKNDNGEEEYSEIVGSGDNLQIGSIERAIITVYFEDKGYGFAKCRRNNVYVHVSELISPENIPVPGDVIEFEVFPGRDSTYRANSIRLVIKKGLSL